MTHLQGRPSWQSGRSSDRIRIHLSIRGYRLSLTPLSLQRYYVGNPLTGNVLHASTVGVGFIPILAATDEN